MTELFRRVAAALDIDRREAEFYVAIAQGVIPGDVILVAEPRPTIHPRVMKRLGLKAPKDD